MTDLSLTFTDVSISLQQVILYTTFNQNEQMENFDVKILSDMTPIYMIDMVLWMDDL